MRKIKILAFLISLTMGLMSFTLVQTTGCGCGSMESGTQIIYTAEGDCCKGKTDEEATASVITWAPGESEGTYIVTSITLVSSNEAQGKCCDNP